MNDPAVVKICCQGCGRLMGRLIQDDSGRVEFMGSWTPEGQEVRLRARLRAPVETLSARWWNHSKPEEGDPRPFGMSGKLDRLGFDCGGRRHHQGRVTMTRLSTLFDMAVRDGANKIYL